MVDIRAISRAISRGISSAISRKNWAQSRQATRSEEDVVNEMVEMGDRGGFILFQDGSGRLGPQPGSQSDNGSIV